MVKEKLKRKYKRFAGPDWSFEQIEELGYNLRSCVEPWRSNNLRLKRRIAWNAISYIASIDRFNVFAPTYVARRLIEQESVTTLLLDESLKENSMKKETPQERKIRQGEILRYMKTLKGKENIEFFKNMMRDFGFEAAKRVMEETETNMATN